MYYLNRKMPREKYIYNQNTLRYEKVKKDRKKTFLQIGGIVFFLSLITLIIYLLSSDFLGISKQQQELIEMHSYYKEMQSQIDLMQKTLENLNERDAAIAKQLMEIEPEQFKELKNPGIDFDTLNNLSDEELLSEMSKNITVMRNKLSEVLSLKLELEVAVKAKEKMLKSIPSIRPLIKPDKGIEYLSGFGYRKDPVFKILKMHNGIDFGAEIGTAVYATGNGKVQQILQKNNGYGKCIVIDHGFGFQSLYAHLSEIEVKVGAELKRGQIIGRVGKSASNTAHLHYEVLFKKKRVNPLPFCREGMSPEEFSLFTEMVSKENQAFSIH